MSKNESKEKAPEIVTPPPVEPADVKQVSTEEWNKMLEAVSQVSSLVETIKTQKQSIEILTAAADKHRIQEIQDKLKTPGNSIVKLRTLRDPQGALKVVVAWVTLENDSYIDPLTKREVANQTIEALLEDDTRQKFQYNNFDRASREQMLLAEVVAKNGESYTVKVLGQEGKQYVVDAKYLN